MKALSKSQTFAPGMDSTSMWKMVFTFRWEMALCRVELDMIDSEHVLAGGTEKCPLTILDGVQPEILAAVVTLFVRPLSAWIPTEVAGLVVDDSATREVLVIDGGMHGAEHGLTRYQTLIRVGLVVLVEEYI